MSNPPPYAPDTSAARYPALDAKHGYDTSPYAVEGQVSSGFYPPAQDDVPPSVEPGWNQQQQHRPTPPVHPLSHVGSSSSSTSSSASLQQQQQQQQSSYPQQQTNQVGPAPLTQQQQQQPAQFYQPQQAQHVGQTNVYFAQPGVPVQIPNGPSVLVGGAAVNFHIYRDGWISRDCRILSGDKKSEAYHIDYPYSFFGAWHVNMRRGSSHGPTVFLITKSAMGWDFTIQDPANPSLSTKLTRSGGGIMGKRKHTFKGFDGKSYAWKGHGLGGDLKCVSYPSKLIVAFYHRTKHSWAKEGRLEILPNGQHLLDLLVATGFATEEWERQNR